MALVKCPECGKEKVSSTATACPECGYNVKEYYENKTAETQLLEEDQYISLAFLDSEITFKDGINNGTKGIAINLNYGNNYKYEETYYVENDSVYIDRHAGTYISKICEDFLICEKGATKGAIPNCEFFDAACTMSLANGAIRKKIVFHQSGTYEESDGKSETNGIYKRKGKFIALLSTDEPKNVLIGLIYDNCFYKYAVLVKKKYIVELEELKKEISDPTYVYNLMQNTKEAMNKCPYCKSINVKKIGNVGRAISFGLFGFGSSKVGKQWHCNSCNSDF